MTSLSKSAGPSKIFKNSTTEFNSAMLANQVFTGPWHDTIQDGSIFLGMSILASAAGSSVAIQVSDDNTVSLFTLTLQTLSPGAGSLTRWFNYIRPRYWRVVITNGATPQTNLELVATTSDGTVFPNGTDWISGGPLSPIAYIVNAADSSPLPDNLASSQPLAQHGGINNNAPLIIGPYSYGGAFSGTANAALSGWSKTRTPTIFKQVTATAIGNTAIWTPGTGNKFRLLKFKIQLTANAAMAAAGIQVVSFQDAAVAIPGLTHEYWLPAAAGAAQNLAYDTGWIDLGFLGILSAAANNALNINLGTALSAGLVNVIVAGVEE